MQYDYYVYRKEQLGDRLNQLERSDNNSRKQAAENTFKINDRDEQEHIEPHLPYLWYEALGRDFKNSIRDAWQKLTTDQNSKLAKQIQSLKKEQDAFGFTPNIDALDRLPHLSFMLRVPFKLRKPYLSKDDRTFHLLDNPIRKDKVFQTPMVDSTSWKGALHSAMIQQLVEWWCNIDDKTSRTHRKELLARRISIARLFGTEKGTDIDDRKLKSYLDSLGDNHLARWYRRYIRRYISSSGFFSGRLYFYPTFFDKIGLEVINPHDRKKGTGKNPILIECVPSGATGELVILYVPFGKVDVSEVAEDLKLTAEGICNMLTVYGFGAKTSSGFGVAGIEGKGELAIRAHLPGLHQPETEIKQPEPELPRYLVAPGKLHPDFQDSDGNFKSEAEYLQGKSGKKAKQLYQKAKDWWEREGRQLAETPAPEPIPEPKSPPPKPSVTEISFVNWSELHDRARQIAEQLQNGGEA